jgi:hypothetical protein
VIFLRGLAQGFDGLCTNVARRDVDDTQEAHFVIGIVSSAQVCKNIFDFAPPVEALCADNFIRQIGTDEGFFEDARLGVGAVHDGKVAGAGLFCDDFVGNGLDNEVGFFAVVVGLVQDDFCAAAALGEELFFYAVRIFVNNRHGCIEDGLGGAVVLLQQNHL